MSATVPGWGLPEVPKMMWSTNTNGAMCILRDGKWETPETPDVASVSLPLDETGLVFCAIAMTLKAAFEGRPLAGRNRPRLDVDKLALDLTRKIREAIQAENGIREICTRKIS